VSRGFFQAISASTISSLSLKDLVLGVYVAIYGTVNKLGVDA